MKRFISADTIVPDPANPQQYNRYSYVLNNPLRYSDPTGHSCYNPSSGSPCTLSDGNGNSSSGVPVPAVPPPLRALIEVEDWEEQLLAITAFVEMHGHGERQAEAITWVALNRMAIGKTIAGVRLYPNPNFSAVSQVAGYVLRNGQFAISVVLAEEYGLLQIGKNGHWEPAAGMTIQEVTAQAYNRLNNAYHGKVDTLLEVVNATIADYNSGVPDPTYGSVFYGHISPEQNELVENGLRAYAQSLGVSGAFRYQVFGSSRSNNPKSLIVNNLTFAP